MSEETLPVTVVVLTRNEARNLPALLASVCDWAAEVAIVDSGSTDATLAIAARHGAVLYTHEFSTHAQQWAWALGNVRISSEWVLALDADQRVTPELAAELHRRLGSGAKPAVDAFFVNRRQVFRGTWIRHGGYYPKYLLKLFRRGRARVDEAELVDHHFIVEGSTGKLENDIVEDNANEASIAAWVAKHNGYATLQARQELARESVSRPANLRGNPDERVQWLRVNLWQRLPLYFRPLLYFLYRYVARLGFLDGRNGFVFHFLQGYWYRLLVDINLDELRAADDGPAGAEDRPRTC